jgi:hypothetical protein
MNRDREKITGNPDTILFLAHQEPSPEGALRR